MEKKQRPGVMIYFDRMVPALARLNDEQAGSLFRAIVEYAHAGTQPELEDLPGIVFDVLRPGIDLDSESYGAKRLRSKYANYCKKTKAKGDVPMSFDDFLLTLPDTDSNQPEPTGNRPDTMRSPEPEPEPKPEPEPEPEPEPKPNNISVSSVSHAHAHAREDDTTDKTDTTQTETVCEVCGRKLTEGVASYSRDKFGRYLCQKCQVTHGPTAPPPPKKTVNSYGTPNPATVRACYQALLEEEEAMDG